MVTNIELFLGNQTCMQCHELEKKLNALRAEMKSKQKLVKAGRGKEQLRKENKDSSQLIKELEKENETLATEKKNLSKMTSEVHETEEWKELKAERDKLRKEVQESRFRCKILEEKIIKSRNVVNRKYK